MAKTSSTMLRLGTKAPAFWLPDTDGNMVSLEDFDDYPVLVVAFICNHCPFVKHIRQGFAEFAREYRDKGVGVVAISANDARGYPADRPEAMAEEKRAMGYVFPYLYDESQDVAKAYRAACTPEFYVFDRDRRLVYRGQFDDSRPGNNLPVTGSDLRAACDAALAGQEPPGEQKPSMGCNIKWRAGNEPEYAA